MRFSFPVRLIGLLVLTANVAWATPATAPLAPFQADYVVLRNGNELGRATLTLREAGNGNWEFSSQTTGTKGMASMLGLDIVEKSTFRWRDGMPEGLQYRYEQHAAIKSRKRSADFDWNAREARNSDGKNDWIAPLDRSAMDRNLVTLAIMARLKAGSQDLVFPVVDKDRIAEQRYTQGARESLSLPAGTVDAVRVERRRDDASRTTTSWFAQQRGWLPVQIEQSDKDGIVTMRLVRDR